MTVTLPKKSIVSAFHHLSQSSTKSDPTSPNSIFSPELTISDDVHLWLYEHFQNLVDTEILAKTKIRPSKIRSDILPFIVLYTPIYQQNTLTDLSHRLTGDQYQNLFGPYIHKDNFTQFAGRCGQIALIDLAHLIIEKNKQDQRYSALICQIDVLFPNESRLKTEISLHPVKNGDHWLLYSLWTYDREDLYHSYCVQAGPYEKSQSEYRLLNK